MKPTQQDLYTSILYRAADIYGVEVDDVEKDIGQNFDPVVRFMAGAMASELEKVYNHLDRAEGRLQERLAQVLLPEYYHLPQAAHALATAQPLSDNLIIDQNVLFQTDIERSTEPPIHFTPVFPSLLLPAEIKIVATDNEIIKIASRGRSRIMEKSLPKEIQKITLGFESADAIENWQGASLYFNLIGRSSLESERTLFYSALTNAQYVHGGKLVRHIKGLGHNELELEDYLNGNERLESNLRARYNHMFVTFTESALEEVKPEEAKSYLGKWLEEALVGDTDLAAKLDDCSAQFDKPLFWLEIYLARPIEVSDISTRLRLSFNVFPVVNRKLNGHRDGEHHFLKNNAIKWIPLTPEDDFLALKSVYEEKSPEPVHYVFKAFSEFRQEKRPSYTIRHGGIGRWDEFNAWKRLSYLIEVLQENYKYEELIDAAASSLSLEEVHQFLGNKIAASNEEEKATKNIYVLLHSGDSSGVRARVEYWTSIGEAANGINSKTSLECISKQKTNIDKGSISLISSSSDGKNPLNNVEKLDAMKSSLLSRGRIVTREDVKDFCREFLGTKLEDVLTEDGVGSDPRYDFGMTRMLNVILVPTKSAKKEDWDGLCRQLQVLISKRSSSNIPINVVTKEMIESK